MQENIKKAKELLEKNEQFKILKIFENIKDKEEFANQVLKIDFEQVNKLYENRNEKFINTNNIEPIKYIDKNSLNSEEISELDELGARIIKQNQYAVVTMAGGQGTRLGWKGPKGTLKLDVGDNGKYIFEILVDTLKKATIKYGVEVFWYIMTSVENNEDTINFFEEHNFFGYPKDKIKFFTQSVLPLIDFEGNLLVDKNLRIKYASDGNGGVFKALKNSGMIEDMQKHNIKWLYVCGVDNIMANMVDSILLGLAIKHNMPSASKSVKKSYPEERVGIFCKKDGKPGIIEYIDMTEDMIYAKNENNDLIYGESNIVGHLFNFESLNKLADFDFKYHSAKKKNTYINEHLDEIEPNEPNAYKFESFIFDGFEFLDDMIILRVNREEEFAPIKNAEGNDSPKTAINIYENYWRKF